MPPLRRNKRLVILSLLATAAIILSLQHWKTYFVHLHEPSNVNYGGNTDDDTTHDKREIEHLIITPTVLSRSTLCPLLSIQNPSITDMKNTPHCKPWKQTEATCKQANYFYNDENFVYCSSKSEPMVKGKICSFIYFTDVQSSEDPFKIHCDRNICQLGQLFVGSIDHNSGVIPLKNWKEFNSAHALELALPEIIQENIKNGFSFCLITCATINETIYQLLTFPQILSKPQVKNNGESFNINVVVVDSVSRNHFYRMLPKTINALTQAAAKKEVKILDYEFLQSLAPYTYTNVRAFMTGSVDQEFLLQRNKTYGINNLFGTLKKRGYKTLFQDESCWYDYWGTILGSNFRRDELPKNLHEFEESWKAFKNMTGDYAIDDYGLTHFSCIVYNMHQVTNMFNQPLKVCFNGKPFGSYTLSYVQNVLTSVDSRSNMAPIFSFLHGNTGHEVTGLRIKVMDKPFSKFVEKMTHLKNTVTIILSDHGPKTTKYSQKILYGRYETYDSFMFMIIPEMIQQKLGKPRMDALIKNQKSLVTMEDLYETFMDMTQGSANNHIPSGLFTQNISNRTCDSLHIVDYGICKCRGWERIFDDQYSPFTWLAEFATGILNNRIQEQFSQNGHYGFGKCLRLQLHSFRNIRQRISKNRSYITTFDLVVQPEQTIFVIQTRHTEKDGMIKNVELYLWRRMSTYRQYKRCKDPTVEIELCVCYRKHKQML